VTNEQPITLTHSASLGMVDIKVATNCPKSGIGGEGGGGGRGGGASLPLLFTDPSPSPWRVTLHHLGGISLEHHIKVSLQCERKEMPHKQL
jgi:hypothetical protein